MPIGIIQIKVSQKIKMRCLHWELHSCHQSYLFPSAGETIPQAKNNHRIQGHFLSLLSEVARQLTSGV